jgi:hypothetical protein
LIGDSALFAGPGVVHRPAKQSRIFLRPIHIAGNFDGGLGIPGYRGGLFDRLARSCVGELLDARRAERREVGRRATGDQIAVDHDLLVDEVGARVAKVGANARWPVPPRPAPPTRWARALATSASARSGHYPLRSQTRILRLKPIAAQGLCVHSARSSECSRISSCPYTYPGPWGANRPALAADVTPGRENGAKVAVALRPRAGPWRITQCQPAVVIESPVTPAARRAASLRFCGSIV